MQLVSDAALLTLADVEDLALEALSFGDVADEACESEFTVDANLADREIHGEDGAVLLPADRLTADADDLALARLAVFPHVAVVLALERFRHQHADVAPDDFRGLVAEHPLGGLVEGLDDSAFVDDDNS